MSILSRYILGQIWAPALLGAVVTCFVVVLGQIQRQLSDFFDAVPIGQVGLGDVFRIGFYVMPVFIAFIIPVTFLLGILLSFGRMAQNSEIVAMKAAGISLKRLVVPVLFAGAALSGFCYWLQEIGQPWAFRRLNTMLSSELPLRVRMDMLPTGAMHAYGDWRVYIGKREENGTLRDIVVMQPQAEGRAQAFYADSAQLVNENGQSVLKLAHGHFIGSDDQGRSRHIVFETNSITVPKLKPRESERERNAATLPQLLEMERKNAQDFALTQNQVVMGTLIKDRNEISKRFSFPLMCLAVTFAAAPLGARTRKAGRSFTFASGLLIVVLYYVLRQIFEPQSLTPLWLTMLRGQGPNLILLVAGFFFIWRVDRV